MSVCLRSRALASGTVLTLLIVASCIAQAQSTQSRQSEQTRPQALPVATARYQLVNAVVNEPTATGGHADFNDLFLLDTQSGRVWIYQEGLGYTDKDGKKQRLDSYFAIVDVDGVTGDVMTKQLNLMQLLNQPANN